MTTKEIVDNGERSTDILSVTYFSDGKTLNATLWLFLPFKEQPTKYELVNYGMLIDTDFSKKTGFDGIDYQLEISWNNKTKTWTKTLESWSSNGNQRTLDKIYNYTGFFENEKSYVLLSLDLSSILYPNKYKVTFYTDVNKDKENLTYLITDSTRWVAIPPLELAMKTLPSSLELRPGESRTVELRLNSTKGFEPTVFLSTKSNFGNIVSDIEFKELQIPSSGIATTAIKITASEKAVVRPYTLSIMANSTFPPEELIDVRSESVVDNPSLPPSESENIISESTMMVTVQEPLTTIDKFNDFWNKLGSPITFFYGVLAGILPWILAKIKERFNKHQ